MTDSDHSRNTLTRQVREALFTEMPSHAEQATLARIRQLLDAEIAATVATDDASWLPLRRPRVHSGRVARRSRGRLAAIALAAIVAITIVAVAAAQSDSVRDFFTTDTPSAQRMESFRVSPTPSSLDRPSTAPISDDVHAHLEQPYQEDPESMIERFGRLEPRDTTRELLRGRWNGRSIAIYARATNQDKVCYTATFGAGVPTTTQCFASYFDLDAPIKIGGTVTPGLRSAGSEIRLFGLAADEVTGVTLRLKDGTASDALMGTNALYWDNSSADSQPRFVDIHLEDGRTVTHPIARYIDPSPSE